MTDYSGLVRSLRECWSTDGGDICDCDKCMFRDKIKVVNVNDEEVYSDYTECEREMVLNAADAIEELLRAAKKMHTWIFLNTGDEQKAYDECGLSDEMNAALGYGGQFFLGGQS